MRPRNSREEWPREIAECDDGVTHVVKLFHLLLGERPVLNGHTVYTAIMTPAGPPRGNSAPTQPRGNSRLNPPRGDTLLTLRSTPRADGCDDLRVISA